ncbi:hypothetical protein CEQ90_12020 [Lewinellaceae bacterium SD302]|nr:hypothetical protein CEQ90_12020 [Lewinellaceae bacterium SD302]
MILRYGDIYFSGCEFLSASDLQVALFSEIKTTGYKVESTTLYRKQGPKIMEYAALRVASVPFSAARRAAYFKATRRSLAIT